MMEAELHAVANWSRLSDRDIHTSNRLVASVFASPQLDTPDLAGDGLRSFHEFNAPDALIGCKVSVCMGENCVGGGPIGGLPGRQADIGLGHGQPGWVGGRYHSSLEQVLPPSPPR
jgi:hypothetical protein